MSSDGLRAVAGAEGPFVSVYLEDSFDTEDAGKQLELKLREIGGLLRDQGADEATAEAVLAAVRDGERPVGRGGRGVVGAGGKVLLTRRLGEPPATQVARVSDLPYLLPFLSHARAEEPYLLVLVDNAGADITAYDAEGREVDEDTVKGQDSPLHKVRGGGFAHARMQANVEETRNQNLEDVAERVAAEASAAGASLVLLAGEQQSRHALHTKLTPALQEITQELSAGSRAAGSATGDLEREIAEALAGRRLRELDELADSYRTGLGREDGLAVTGLAPVVTAVAEANVDTLLVGGTGDAEVVVGDGPGQVAMDPEGLRAFGVESPRRRRADEALPWAALVSGASVAVMDERVELRDGVGALLRHT